MRVIIILLSRYYTVHYYTVDVIVDDLYVVAAASNIGLSVRDSQDFLLLLRLTFVEQTYFKIQMTSTNELDIDISIH